MKNGIPVQPPSAVSARAADICSLAESLADDYRWLFFAAYDRTTRDEAKTRSSSRPDPVGELVVDGIKEESANGDRPGGKTLMRRNLALAGKLTEEAFAKLEKAHRLVLGDPKPIGHPHRKTVRGSLDSLDPRTIDMHSTNRLGPGDYVASLDAQERRNGRGEGFGET